LEAGARVIIITETEEELKTSIEKFEQFRSHLIGIVGHFESRAQIEEIRSVVRAALRGETVDHVISAFGNITKSMDGISTGDINALKKTLDDNLYPTILCAQVFLQDLRDKDGSTYTIVSGGYAHKCYYPK
jgi:short-subunit dehydrogenase involved in D-alanine esterification of teichoic acids